MNAPSESGLMIGVVSGSLSAVITAVVTYLSVAVKVRKDLEAKYDLDLRGKRVTVYKELWKLLEPLAKYARAGPFTPAGAKDLAAKLRAWYFDTGGLFMSEDTRDAYFALQDGLKAITEGPSRPPDQDVGPDFIPLRDKGSKLRTQMTEDVGTRRSPLFRYR